MMVPCAWMCICLVEGRREAGMNSKMERGREERRGRADLLDGGARLEDVGLARDVERPDLKGGSKEEGGMGWV